MQPNNAFERTVGYRGRTVLAMELRARQCEYPSWPAAQLGR